jgi:hypothetical protein
MGDVWGASPNSGVSVLTLTRRTRKECVDLSSKNETDFNNRNRKVQSFSQVRNSQGYCDRQKKSTLNMSA